MLMPAIRVGILPMSDAIVHSCFHINYNLRSLPSPQWLSPLSKIVWFTVALLLTLIDHACIHQLCSAI